MIHRLRAFLLGISFVPAAFSGGIEFRADEVPVWNQTSTWYRTIFPGNDGDIHGYMEVGQGGEKNAGLMGFHIYSASDRKRILFSRSDPKQKPLIYPTDVKVWLDGKLFLVDKPHVSLALTETTFMFPYAPARFDTEVTMSDGRSYRMGIKIPGIPYSNPQYNLLKQPAAPQEEWDRSDAPYGSDIYVRECISSLQSGVIKRVRLLLHQHPIFSPDGDTIIGDAMVHLPVYQIYLQQSNRLTHMQSHEEAQKDQRYTVTSECETVKGKRFTSTRTFPIGRDRRPPP